MPSEVISECIISWRVHTPVPLAERVMYALVNVPMLCPRNLLTLAMCALNVPMLCPRNLLTLAMCALNVPWLHHSSQ